MHTYMLDVDTPNSVAELVGPLRSESEEEKCTSVGQDQDSSVSFESDTNGDIDSADEEEDWDHVNEFVIVNSTDPNAVPDKLLARLHATMPSSQCRSRAVVGGNSIL